MEKRSFPTLFEMIFKECERKGWTQTKIAKACNVTDSAVSRWRKGDVKIPLIRFFELCELCHLSPSDMLEKWQRTEEFAKTDTRRQYYERIVELVLKSEYAIEFDGIMRFIEMRIEMDKEKKSISTLAKKMRRWVKVKRH